MKKHIYPSVVIAVICIVVALLLSTVSMLTEDRIKFVQYQKEQSDLKEVMPEGKNFTPLQVTGLEESITTVYSEDGGGYIFKISTQGYKSGLIILCGIDADGNLTGVKSTKTSETPSKENGIGLLFDGMSMENHSEIIVSGATKTSVAYSKAVSYSFEAFNQITSMEDNNHEK